MSIEKPILKLYNTDFTLVALIDDYQQAQIEHNLYSAGAFSISINYNIPNAKLFERGLFIQFGDNARDFCVIQSVENSIDSSGKGSEYITVSGYDCRYLFKRRIIKNLNSNDTWSMTAKGELCIRSLVADQCGVNAEEKRKLPVTNIIPSENSAIGSTYSVSEAYSNLYDTLVTIATQSEIGWAVEFNGSSLNLVVYQGENKSNNVFFSTDFESLANGKYKDSNDSYSNSVYIGGKGTGSERDIYEGEVDEPEGLDRFESYDNQSSMTTEEEYEEKARSILSQYGQTITVSGAGLAKCPYVFREQYDIGDIIKLSFSRKSANTQILSVSESWAKGSYSLSFNFGKPVNTLSDQLNIMLRKIQDASNKSSSTTSVKWYDVANNIEQDSGDVTFDTLGFTGTLTSDSTFKLYLDNEKTGAKSYNIYAKNLSGNYTLTLTTGNAGATNVTLKGGVNLTGRILIDEDGNIINQGMTATNSLEEGNTQPVTSDAVYDAISSAIGTNPDVSNATGVLPIAHGGTGKTTAQDACNELINGLTTEYSTPVDTDYYVSQYVNGGDTTKTFHRRPMSALWEYIKGKISSILGLTTTDYGGTAITAKKMKVATSFSTSAITYVKISGMLTTNTEHVFTLQSREGELLLISTGYGDRATIKAPKILRLCNQYSKILGCRLLGSYLIFKIAAWSHDDIISQIVGNSTQTISYTTTTETEYNSGTEVRIKEEDIADKIRTSAPSSPSNGDIWIS